MTRAESALAVACKLAEVAADEKRLGRVVAAAHMCAGGADVYDHEFGGYVRLSHLSTYLRRSDHVLDDDRGSARSRMLDCPRCAAAYQAIQDRKAVRRRRGALRAALVRIGKLANADAGR